MDKEQRKRMAEREFVFVEPDGREVTYTIQVSGQLAQLHRSMDAPWDNESGTGPDLIHDSWTMSLDNLKKLIEGVNWSIQKSEAFEKAHPMEERVGNESGN